MSHDDEAIVEALQETRSVSRTAARLCVPLEQVQRVALMAYGLGRLDVDLADY